MNADYHYKTFFGHPKPAKGIEESAEAPVYEAYTKLSDCVDSDDKLYNIDLALEWDVLRDDIHAAKCLLARKRCSAAVSMLEKM